jgi:hypothetical protein
MLPLSEDALRSSFINTSLRERKAIALPDGFPDLNWDEIDYLGWRDRKLPDIGYVVAEVDGAPVGILMREATRNLRTRPQCAWCEDVHLPNDVVFYSVKRAGQAGRNGNTVGTLVCAGFECSANVRKRPPVAYIGFDVEAARLQRIDALRENVQSFVRDVREGQ